MPITSNTRSFLLLLFFATAVVVSLVDLRLNSGWTFVLSDTLVTSLTLSFSIWGGMLVVKSYPTKVGIVFYALLMGLATGAISWYANRLALRWWFAEDPDNLIRFGFSSTPRLLIFLLAHGWAITLTAVNQRSIELENQFKNYNDAGALHREAELFKLRQQLQPHFLYNSLNSINALILLQPEKAQEMIGKLSDFLRNSVKREAREQIPVEEELQYIEAYLAIEAVRFGDRLRLNYDKHYTHQATIPPFLLQPILENAIKFGLYGRTGNVEIDMKITRNDHYLTLKITNPFDPHNRPPSGTGFGLEGIRRRLYLLYARTDLLETRQDREKFVTILRIPQDYV